MSNVNLNDKTLTIDRASIGLIDTNGIKLSIEAVSDGEFLQRSGSSIVSGVSSLPPTQFVYNSGSRLALTSSFITVQIDNNHAYMAFIGEDLTQTTNWKDLGSYLAFPSDLVFHMDTLDISTLYQVSGSTLVSSDGDPVTYIVDKSGAGNHLLLPGEAYSASYSASYRTLGISGTPSLQFNGSGSSFVSNTDLLSSSLPPVTMFVVGTPSFSGATYQDAVIGDQVGVGTALSTVYWSNGYRGVTGGGQDYVSTSQWSSGSANVFCVSMLTNDWNHDVRMYYNGLDCTPSMSMNALSMNGSKFHLGNVSVTADSSFPGLIGEVLIFNKYLTESEIKYVNSYLLTKWKIVA